MDLDDEAAGKAPTDTSAVARRARRPTLWLALAMLIAVVLAIGFYANSRVGTGTQGDYAVSRQAARQADAGPAPDALGRTPVPPSAR